MARLLDYDPITKTKQLFHVLDEHEGRYAIETVQDVTDIVETNKALYAQTDERARWGDIAHVGSIDHTTLERLMNEGAIDALGFVKDPKWLLKWLQDPANRDFKARPGRLI